MRGNSKTLLLLNERAAEDAELADAIAVARSAGHDLEIRPLTEAGDALRRAREAAATDHRLRAVVACGGDGTLNEVVNGVLAAEAPCPVGVIPFGTANDFATAAGIADRLTRAEQLALILESEPIMIDVGSVGDEHFINCASVGFGAEVTAETPRLLKALLGGVAYSLTGAVKAVVHEEMYARVRGGKLGDWDGGLLFLTVANGKFAGGGFAVGREATVDDGVLDVFLMPTPEDGILLEALTALTEALISDEPYQSEESRYEQVTELSVESDAPMAINLDGEAKVIDELKFTVLSGKLPFFMPAGSPLITANRGN